MRKGYGGTMPLRAIDFHVHLPTPDWLDGSMAGYVEAAEAYFRSPAQRQSLDELADRYRQLEGKAVRLAWDEETATPSSGNSPAARWKLANRRARRWRGSSGKN